MHWGVLGCIGLYLAVVCCSVVLWAVLGYLYSYGLYWDVLGCTGLHWAVLGCTGLYWAVLDSTGLDLAAQGFEWLG